MLAKLENTDSKSLKEHFSNLSVTRNKDLKTL